MCIITHEKLEPQIAEKDIEVIKILSYKEEYFKFLFINFKRRKYQSPYFDKIYKLKRTYTSRISYNYISDKNEYQTKDGLYSFANKVSITLNMGFYPIPHGYRRGMFKAIIPKGAEYYTNSRGEFCSNKLKILSHIEDLHIVLNYKKSCVFLT